MSKEVRKGGGAGFLEMPLGSHISRVQATCNFATVQRRWVGGKNSTRALFLGWYMRNTVYGYSRGARLFSPVDGEVIGEGAPGGVRKRLKKQRVGV